MLSFYRVSWIPVMLFSNTPMSATVLQHHRPNSSQAFLLPPDVLEAAGSCWRCNILHPTHSWFQPVTVSSVFLKEHPPSNWFQWLVVVLFQLLPGFSISRIKHESIEPYDCAVLEQRARTVTSVQVWTVHLGASYFMLCPWVRTQHLGEKKKKKKKQPFVWWIWLAVSSLQQWSGRIRGSAAGGEPAVLDAELPGTPAGAGQ